LYAFPPTSLLRPTVEKAIADRALCILVLPVAILTPYCGKLLASSVLQHRAPYADAFLRISDPARPLLRPGHCVPSELAVFACDFGLLAGLSELSLWPALACLRSRCSMAPSLGASAHCVAAPATRTTSTAFGRLCSLSWTGCSSLERG
jgi:hypothetical protein